MSNLWIRRYLTPGDKVLIGSLILLSLVSYPLVRNMAQEGNSVQIEADGKMYKVVSLDASQTLAVPGPLGNTLVVIHAGKVHVSESPCTAKICVKTGEISHTGQIIVCIPNKVIIRVTGEEDAAYDAVTQ